MAELEVFEKKPLGGTNIREIAKVLAANGKEAAEKMLADQVKNVKPVGIHLPKDHVVLLLGGSNGILRACAIQLLFGENVPVYAVHYDRESMQIGHYHVQAVKKLAEERGIDTQWWNMDATDPKSIQEVVDFIKTKYKVVHLMNGIAAGATKRYEKYGKINVKDLDVAFHPVLQYPDFSSLDNIRKFGMVEVQLASEQDIERTNKFMGTSTTIWVNPLAAAGLIQKDVSVVAFADYDFEKDDPVYGMGPLAGAKILQRESMDLAAKNHGVKAVRLCYPAMDTTAIGAIPGGLLMLSLTTLILQEKGQFKGLKKLAVETMQIFRPEYRDRELRLDTDFQKILPEFHKREEKLQLSDIPGIFDPLTKIDLP
jgi:enoyl-[acyl-carrier protein] reductase/trans-2-enoyl-CoA reductase (NAD+)